MGSAASIPGDDLTKEQVQALAGDDFDDNLWGEKSMFDQVSKDDYESFVVSKNMKRFFLADLHSELSRVFLNGKTPLILNPLEDGESTSKIDSYYTYQDTVVLEMKKMVKQVFIDKSPKEDSLEEMRTLLLSAFQAVPPRNGRTLLIRLTNTAPDFEGTFFSESSFPREVFDPSVIKTEDCYSKFVKDEDKARTNGFFLPGEEFRVVVTSTFSPEDAWGFLKAVLPLDMFEILVIKPGNPPPPWIPDEGTVIE